jgi:hypothetical protein
MLGRKFLGLSVHSDSHCLTDKGYTHRVDRVLGFFSSRPNWDSPTSSPAGEYAPPPFGSGGGKRLRERGSHFGQRDRHCGTLGNVLCEDTSWNQQVRETNVISSLLDCTDSFLICKLLYVSVCEHITTLECIVLGPPGCAQVYMSSSEL